MKRYLLLLGGAGLLAACTTSSSSSEGGNVARQATSAVVLDSVTGTVTYRDRSALPATAVVRVVLQDVSLQDVRAKVIDSVTLRPNGRQVPLAFSLRYDTARIAPGNTYTVQARITADGQLLYQSDVAYPVITRGNPQRVHMTLRRVR